MRKLLLYFIFLNLFSTFLIAGEYAIISNKNMKDLSKAQVKAIFLKKIVFVDDIKTVPLNLGARDNIRSSFERQIIKMNFNRLKSYWTKQHYLGHRPPNTMKSQKSVKAFVKKVDGAIGYVDMSNVDSDVKVLYSWSD